MILLSIGIPTFNSNRTLMRLLESIFAQLTTDTLDKIEIVISDNDPNSGVIDLLKSKISSTEFRTIRYNRNLTNIGYDKNLEKLKQIAAGKYLKIIADDDILDSSYLKIHIKTLEDKNPDIVINEFQSFRINQPKTTESFFPLDAKDFSPPWTFIKLQELNGRFGQVSTLTFRLSLLREMPEQSIKTNFIHLFWFYSLIENASLVYERKVTVFCELGSPNFSSSYSEIILTPFGALRAARIAKIKNSRLSKQIIRKHRNYAFNQLRLVPFLSISQKFMIIKRNYLEFFIGLPTFLFYLPLFFIPKAVKVQLSKFKKMKLDSK
jgi:glycosyltransferase involved in cell wall biosynthesis